MERCAVETGGGARIGDVVVSDFSVDDDRGGNAVEFLGGLRIGWLRVLGQCNKWSKQNQ